MKTTTKCNEKLSLVQRPYMVDKDKDAYITIQETAETFKRQIPLEQSLG